MTVSWYARIVGDPGNVDLIEAACAYFDGQYQDAVQEVNLDNLRGQQVSEIEKRLPGIVGFRYAQLKELDAILVHIKIRELAIKGLRRRHYLEHYNRALTPITAEKYVEADDDVLAMAMLHNRVTFTRNQFDALSKQLENLHYNLGNLTRLLVAGVDDAVF